MKTFKILLCVACVAMIYGIYDYSFNNDMPQLLLLNLLLGLIPLCVLFEGFASWFGDKLEGLNG
jgi:hypothetical protein